LSSEQHREFLKSYIQSAGGNVSAKNRDAEYQTKDLMVDIIATRALINKLTTDRDLIVFLLLSRQPVDLSMFPPAIMDEGGLLSA
jgi:hypothetical protein